MENVCLVVPAFEPSPSLAPLVRELAPEFAAVVVVDDGSRGAAGIFADVRGIPGVTVLIHPENRGKGAALKTAFAEVLARHPGCGVVTADADGQHLAADVLSVAGALVAESRDGAAGRMVVGARRFTGPGVPFRSRLGNLWTAGEFRLLTGRRVGDTQSGLRGIPAALLPSLLEIPGERYEYEIAVLVAMARAGKVVETPIATVYADGNAASHYRPLADTWRTQRALFAAAFRRLGGTERRILHVCAGWQPWNGAANIARLIVAEQERAGCRVSRRTWAGIGDLRRADEVWVHCAWMPCLWWAALWARRLVWMPEGSYDPVRLAYHGWKKCLAGPFERWALRRADRVVATCPAEAEWIRAYEPKIKNIEISDIKRFFSLTNANPLWGHSPQNQTKNRGHSPKKNWGQSPKNGGPKNWGLSPVHVLYLGRAHPLKGVEFLRQAVTGEKSFELREVSGVFGDEKERIWEWCDILSLPTLSDNFGLVVAEALSRGKFVLTTDGAPAWGDGGDYGGRLVYVEGYRGASPAARPGMLRRALQQIVEKATSAV